MSNLVTGYAKRMRTNGQLFGETESVAVTCIYVDEITVMCIVECGKASECVQISCRFRVLDDINYLKANKGESTFLPNAPGFPQDHCCFKVPTLCPFVRLVRASSECNTGGITLTGETEVFGEKLVTMSPGPPQRSHGQAQDRTMVSAMRGRRLTA